MGIRDLVKAISPPWLVGPGTPSTPLPAGAGIAERFMYAIGIQPDFLIFKVQEAIKLRFPGYLNASSLAQIGDDRAILRGYLETDDSYAARLRAWLDTWRHAGAARGVLQAVASYLPSNPGVRSVLDGDNVSDASVWDVLTPGQDPASAPTTTHVSPKNWYWDALNWVKRRWLIIEGGPGTWAEPTYVYADPSATWGMTGSSWGINNPPERAETLRQLVRTWKGGGTRYPWIVVNFSPGQFDPSATYPAPGVLPDPSFGTWSKIDTSGARAARVSSRFAAARYINGVMD